MQGVALGQFTRCGDPALVQELLRRRLEPPGAPVVADLPVGHAPGHRPVGLGVPPRPDGGAGTLTGEPLVG